MRLKNVKIDVQNAEYSELNYDLQDKISENILAPINNGYNNFIDVEINCWLGDEYYQTDEMKKDLMQICDMTEKEFKKAVKNQDEISFYVSYEV